MPEITDRLVAAVDDAEVDPLTADLLADAVEEIEIRNSLLLTFHAFLVRNAMLPEFEDELDEQSLQTYADFFDAAYTLDRMEEADRMVRDEDA